MTAGKFYERYGGIMQSMPLTAEERRYDDTCREIDQLESDIGGMSAALFTARELLWLSWFVQKTFVSPTQAQLDRQLVELRALMDTLKSRSSPG